MRDVAVDRPSGTTGVSQGVMRSVSLIALAGGAALSVALMLYAGRHNDLRLLKALFTVWVLSPFAALGWAHAASRRWIPASRALLYSLTIGVTLGSLVLYGARVLWPPSAQGAFVFVAVPPATWIVMGAALAVGAQISRARAR